MKYRRLPRGRAFPRYDDAAHIDSAAGGRRSRRGRLHRALLRQERAARLKPSLSFPFRTFSPEQAA